MPAMALVSGEIDDFGLLVLLVWPNLVAISFARNFDSDDQATIIEDLIIIKAVEPSVTPVDTTV